MLLSQKPGEGSNTSLTACDREACSDSPIYVNQVPSPQYTSNGWFSGTENPACIDGWISGRVLLLLPWDREQVKNLFIYRSWFNHIF